MPAPQALATVRMSRSALAVKCAARPADAARRDSDRCRELQLPTPAGSPRDNRRLKRLLKDAQLRISSACMEDVEASAARGLERFDPRPVHELCLGRGALERAHLRAHRPRQELPRLRPRPTRLPARPPSRLSTPAEAPQRFGLARAESTHPKALARIARAEVLVLDDLRIGTPKDAQRQDLLEVFEDRYGKTSTVVAGQLPVSEWHEWVGDATLADAILDRLVHSAYKLTLKGASRREEQAQQAD